MNLATLAGLVAGSTFIILSYTMGGGNPAGLFQVESVMVVFGGTLGAVLVNFPLNLLMRTPKGVMKAFLGKPPDATQIIPLFVRLAEKARREGLLSLEEEESSLDSDFVRKGVALVVDGTDPELITAILEIEISAMEKRHDEVQGVLRAAGGYLPAMGIVGTVMGLVIVLARLDEPETLGPGIAVAFLTTLYGVLFANLIVLPLAGKLRQMTQEEVMVRRMMLEGILSVQAGENPRVVQEKLLGFLSPAQRAAVAGEAMPGAREAAVEAAA